MQDPIIDRLAAVAAAEDELSKAMAALRDECARIAAEAERLANTPWRLQS